MCAVHARLPLVAVAGAEHINVVSSLALRVRQRLLEAGCRFLAWHPEGPTLAALVVRGAAASVLLLTSDGGDYENGAWLLRCVEKIQLSGPAPVGSLGLCIAPSHLLVGGAELRVWACTFVPWCTTSPGVVALGGPVGPHLIHCAEDPEVCQSFGDAPATCLRLHDSERYLLTLHAARGSGGGDSQLATPSGGGASAAGDARSLVQVWFASEASALVLPAPPPGHDRSRRAVARRASRGASSGGLPHIGASPLATPCGVEGVGAVTLRHGESVLDARWAPSTAWAAPAVLAVVTASGAVTLWREGSPTEALCFLVEAFRRLDDLWSDPSGPQPPPIVRAPAALAEAGEELTPSLCWAPPRFCPDAAARGSRTGCSAPPSWDERPAIPLRRRDDAFGGPAVAWKGLLALSDGRRLALAHMEPGHAGIRGHGPIEVRWSPHAAPVLGASLVLLDAARMRGEACEAVDILATASGDLCRARLEGGEPSALLAVAGSALARSAVGAPAVRNEAGVEAVAVHPAFGFVAVLSRHPWREGSSSVWLGDVPRGRATLMADRYKVGDAAMQREGLGTLTFDPGFRDLHWAPGRAVPPVLLGIRRGCGTLAASVVDPLRGVVGSGEQTAVCCGGEGKLLVGVRSLEVVSAEDAFLCLLCDVGDVVELMLGRLEPTPGVAALNFRSVYTLGGLVQGTRCALEWLSGPGGLDVSSMQRGDLLGQLAVWEPDATERTAEVVVRALASDGFSPAACSRRPALRARAGRGSVPLLDLALRGEWLVALASRARVLVWHVCADEEAAGAPGAAGAMVVATDLPSSLAAHAALHMCAAPRVFRLATKPYERRRAAQVSPAVSSAFTFHPWKGGSLGGTAGRSSGTSSASLSRGRVVPCILQAGGLGVLISGDSDTDIAFPAVLVRTRSGSEGEVWLLVDLHIDALPLPVEAVSWLSGGCVLCAGYAAGQSVVLTAELSYQAQGWLRASAPSPAYHPETLLSLLARREDETVRRVLTSLLSAVSGGRVGCVHPLLDLAFDDFHSGVLFKASEQPSESASDTAATLFGGSSGVKGDTAADLFGDSGGRGDTASALFGGEDSDDDALIARLARRRLGNNWYDDEEDVTPATEPADPSRPGASARVEAGGWKWQLAPAESERLAMLLQTTPLPLVSAHEQSLLLVLLQDLGSTANASDLDECGRRYSLAFDVHVAVKRRLSWGAAGDVASSLQHLSSEDLCWALHSDCQGTLVDHVVQSAGADLDWPALRRSGVGLWLTDLASMKKLLETLPRSILKRQGQDIKPESVALWYALLGRRSLLASLYRREKQERVADFLSNDLSEEPWRTKAEKNAFELVRQRRYEMACAFFVFAGQARNAVDICARYLDDWPLAVLVAQHLKALEIPEADEALRRTLLQEMLPLANRVGDPWLASLACWRAGEHAIACRCVYPPYRMAPLIAELRAASAEGEDDEDVAQCNEDADSSDVGAGAESVGAPLFSGRAVRHSGCSPGLPRFLEVVCDAMAKKRLPLCFDPSEARASEAAATSRAYIARRQPLLALPPEGSSRHVLPWRTALGIARAIAALSCAAQCQAASPAALDGPAVARPSSPAFADVAAVLQGRLGLPAGVVRAVLAEAYLAGCSASTDEDEASATFIDVAPFYSPSAVASGQTAERLREAWRRPPYLWPHLGTTTGGAAGETWLSEELRLCRELRRLAPTHAGRSLVADDQKSLVSGLAGVIWRAMPRLRDYLREPARLPAPSLHLTAHLLCALCVSRPPAASVPLESMPGPEVARFQPELPGDLAMVVAAMAVTSSLLLTLRCVAPHGGLWGDALPPGQACGATAAAEVQPSSSAWEMDAYFSDAAGDVGGVPEEAVTEDASPPAPAWDPAFWQGLRVLLEHLQGDATDQRRLHRSGTVPSLVLSLFLQPSLLADESGTAESCAPPAPVGADVGVNVDSAHGRDDGSATPATPEEALRGLAALAARDAGAAEQIRDLLQCGMVELVLERLVTLLGSIRKKPTDAALSHWITVWYSTLLASLRSFLHNHVRGRLLRAAWIAVASHGRRLALSLCAPEVLWAEALGAPLAGGPPFAALWQQLGGPRRLRLLLAHHPAICCPAASLPRHVAVLWRCAAGAGVGPPSIRFVCADRSMVGSLRLQVAHSKGATWVLHAGHAARWSAGGTGEDDEGPGSTLAAAERAKRRFEALAEPYAQSALCTDAHGVRPGLAAVATVAFDVASELLLGHTVLASSSRLLAAASSTPVAEGPQEHGQDVEHFFATLRRPQASSTSRPTEAGGFGTAPAAAAAMQSLLCAEAHPSRAVCAVADETGLVYLWSFGEATPRCALPRPAYQGRVPRSNGAPGTVEAPGRDAGMDAGSRAARTGQMQSTAEAQPAAERELEQRKCTLSWNAAGDRLLGVGSATGVSIWALGEGRGCAQALQVPTGAAQTRVNCGVFVSPSSVVATAGRRAEADLDLGAGGALRSWPYHAAGVCIWDTLAPPGSALVAHDGLADHHPAMPADYTCLAWAAGQQRLLCGTKQGELRVFDLRQQRVAQRLAAHEAAVQHVFAIEGSGRLVTLSAAAELKVWDLQNFECLETRSKLHSLRGVSSVLGKAQALTCAAMLSDHHLITGGQDGVVLLMRL